MSDYYSPDNAAWREQIALYNRESQNRSGTTKRPTAEVVQYPKSNGATPTPEPAAHDAVGIDDFVAFMPGHSYIYKVTGDHWPAASVNARIEPIKEGDRLIKASEWLDKNSPVEQMTWMPGEPQIIKDRLIAAEGGVFSRVGAAVFNLYHPPQAKPKPEKPITDADVAMWLDHIKKIYPTDAAHIVKYFAYKVQHPGDKINHST
jgi:hypothetical protein